MTDWAAGREAAETVPSCAPRGQPRAHARGHRCQGWVMAPFRDVEHGAIASRRAKKINAGAAATSGALALVDGQPVSSGTKKESDDDVSNSTDAVGQAVARFARIPLDATRCPPADRGPQHGSTPGTWKDDAQAREVIISRRRMLVYIFIMTFARKKCMCLSFTGRIEPNACH